METLRSSIIEFAINHRKELAPAEGWLNDFDGEFEDAWEVAIGKFSSDCRKIIVLAKLAFDEFHQHQNSGPISVIFCGNYSSSKHPNYRVIQNALNEGSKPHDTKDLIDLKKATDLFACSRTHIKRLIEKGELKSYKKTPNGKHYISIQQSKLRLTVQPKYTT